MSEQSTTDTTTEAPASETAAEKPKVDHTANLVAAFSGVVGQVEAGATELTDEQVSALQEAYRDVPSAARAVAQGNAMQAVIEAGRPDLLPAFIAAITNLPKATKARTAKPTLDPTVAAAIELIALVQAYNSLKEANTEASDMATGWLTEGIPADHSAAVEAKAKKALDAVQKSSRGGSGDRSTFTETLKDLVEDGRVPGGSKLTCAVEGVVANVRKDGTVSVKIGDELQTFDNLSGAAKAVKLAAGAKNPSVNGWDFFLYDGKAVGKLRKA